MKGDTEAVIAQAQALGESVSHLAAPGAWGVIKVWTEVHVTHFVMVAEMARAAQRDLYRDVLEASARDERLQNVEADDAAAKARL